MPLRDIVLTLTILGSLPVILKRPYVGVLMWCWLSYMNPHRLAWDFAYGKPFAQLIAIVTIIAEGMTTGTAQRKAPATTTTIATASGATTAGTIPIPTVGTASTIARHATSASPAITASARGVRFITTLEASIEFRSGGSIT